ncbi:MAG: 2-amino-4-ketopentanoate thiolase [Clostridiales bacterium]|nr:2-amino-4-ketopentanoate thiolase [Clostridiales bacterium]
MAKKGEWVRVHCVVLTPEERSAAVPEDTKRVPLERWTKGYLAADAQIGETATIVTRTGRTVSGELVEADPHYTHSFGDFVPELQRAGDEAVLFLFGGDGE